MTRCFQEGRTPLHAAAEWMSRHSADKVVKLLAAAGANINARDKVSWDACVLLRTPSLATTTTLHTVNTRSSGAPRVSAASAYRVRWPNNPTRAMYLLAHITGTWPAEAQHCAAHRSHEIEVHRRAAAGEAAGGAAGRAEHGGWRGRMGVVLRCRIRV